MVNVSNKINEDQDTNDNATGEEINSDSIRQNKANKIATIISRVDDITVDYPLKFKENSHYDFNAEIDNKIDFGGINDSIDSQTNEELREKYENSSANGIVLASQSDASIPLIKRLGCGYNVFGEYASDISVKQSVLNLNALIKDNKVATRALHRYDLYETFGESIKSYVKERSISIGASGSFMGFGGGVSSSFSSAQQRE